MERLAFPSVFFDTLVNTMAISGYMHDLAIISEPRRVLAPGGKPMVVDVNFPNEGGCPGIQKAKF